MQIKIDDVLIYEMPEWKKEILKNELRSSELDGDMKRRVCWILDHKVEECSETLRSTWEKKMVDEGAKTLPTGDREFSELVFARKDYKNRDRTYREEQETIAKEALAKEAPAKKEKSNR
jgi:hypothetical protein